MSEDTRSLPPVRKYKDGWWTSVGRQSLSKRPPGAIPSLLRQSDLWARAIAAHAAEGAPPTKKQLVKTKLRDALRPSCVKEGKRWFKRACARWMGSGKEVVVQQKKTLWSSSERVNEDAVDPKREWRVGEVGAKLFR